MKYIYDIEHNEFNQQTKAGLSYAHETFQEETDGGFQLIDNIVFMF